MAGHLRANLLLLVLTVALCCVLYPLALWGVGQAFFRTQAEGSLITDDTGTVRGSRLIGQPFSDAQYFQPRPSAAGSGYDASASGASNLAASNPKLRGRVAQALGPIVRYKKDGPRKGALVGPDIEAWFQEQARKKRDVVSKWVEDNPTLVAEWAKSTDPVKTYVKQWAADHPEVLAAWKAKNPDATNEPSPDDLAPYFFTSFVQKHPGKWPCEVTVNEKTFVAPGDKGDDIKKIFFDTWLRENPKKIDPLTDLEQVPADMVMASGSGLDPHITLRNAEYQLELRVAAEWGKITKQHQDTVEKQIRDILRKHAFTPLGGLVGELLVNVLEVNLALDNELKPAK
jgi:K+-transporting ATPase ATPase C chain